MDNLMGKMLKQITINHLWGQLLWVAYHFPENKKEIRRIKMKLKRLKKNG